MFVYDKDYGSKLKVKVRSDKMMDGILHVKNIR